MPALGTTLRGVFVPIGIGTDAQIQRKVKKMQNATIARNIRSVNAIQLRQSDSWSWFCLFAASPIRCCINLSLTPPLNNFNTRNNTIRYQQVRIASSCWPVFVLARSLPCEAGFVAGYFVCGNRDDRSPLFCFLKRQF